MTERNTSERENLKIASNYRALLKAANPLLKKDDLKSLRKAIDMALDSSKNKPNYLGEKYFFYPLAINRILAKEIEIGGLALICAMLYNYVKDGNIELKTIKSTFGEKAAEIIDSLTKISSFGNKNILANSENFRRLILTMSSDLRVVLIKIAECLYTMRHIHRLPTEQQKYMSDVAFQLYAPLAHRLGLYNIKTELEDISLKYREPEIYKSIEEKLKNTTTKRNKFIRKFIEPIKETLEKQGFDFEIKGRTKSINSILNKMQKQEVDFEEIYDIFAIRIIIKNTLKDEKTDCWSVYSVVTNFYQPNPRRMRDWISIPKSNGYESLHTTVVVPGGKWVEVQIRTERMNEIAEKGLAAHWKYKGGREEQKMEEWLGKVRDILDTSDNVNENSSDNLKLNLYEDEVFVFTPKGDLKKFPKGSSVLDFAFDIHTALGASCIGARINNKNVPIRHILRNGDEIEIITSKQQKPKSDWLDFVFTPRAKTKIKQILRDEENKEAENGKEILKRRLKNWKIEYNDDNITKLLKYYKFEKSVELHYAIATEKIDISEIKELFDTENPKDSELKVINEKHSETESYVDQKDKNAIDLIDLDKQLKGIEYKFSPCCNPVLGDNIFGFVTIGDGIKIHRIDCPNAQQLLSRYHYRIVEAKWRAATEKTLFEAVISVTGIDELGLVNNISSLISNDLRVNMRSISFNSKNGLFDGKITLLVKDIEHLNALIQKINKVHGVKKVTRIYEY